MKGFLAFLLIISLIINAMLIFDRNQTDSDEVIQQPPTVDISQLRTIAQKCGVDESKVDSFNANELLTEIKIKFNESNSFYGETLNEDEIKRVELILFGEDKLLKILREQFEFLKTIKGKDIIILH